MQRMVWAVLIGFAAALAVGPWTIRELRKLKAGQNIYELAPESHKSKQGTPTMGGLAFAALALLIGFAPARSISKPICPSRWRFSP